MSEDTRFPQQLGIRVTFVLFKNAKSYVKKQ